MILTNMAANIFAIGDDWPLIPFAVVLDSDLVTPVNISGWTLKFALFADRLFTKPIFSVTTTGGQIVIVSGSGGTFTVAIAAALSTEIAPSAPLANPLQCFWQVHRIDSGNTREAWLRGLARPALVKIGTTPIS